MMELGRCGRNVRGRFAVDNFFIFDTKGCGFIDLDEEMR
jgi:hypothetical protein